MQKEHKINGVILDLRFNAGGVLSQAIAVTGLFIKKGVVVSVKDENGQIHPLRNLDSGVIWNGPLMVLTNRGSASAAEIVAGALQDYGRALIVGDDHTFGKGSFQTFTLSAANASSIDPQGEFKVTRGCYYTVSGKTPQLTGVKADIEVPSGLETLEIGEMYSKYPLDNSTIEPAFEDTLSDVPFFQREKIRRLYLVDRQDIETRYKDILPELLSNSKIRQAENKAYAHYLEMMKKNDPEIDDYEKPENRPDFQLYEALDVMKDCIILLDEKQIDKEAA